MTTPTVADTLQLAHGIERAEFDRVVAILSRLDDRLRSFPAGTVKLQLSVKERDTESQRTTLEGWFAGHPRLVATSSRTDIDAALAEVRDDMVRQISDAKNRNEPRNNRALRETQ
ncbi:MAG: HPF/RaiA family ribosome-associated protein [Acidimicrobiales bacterium]